MEANGFLVALYLEWRNEFLSVAKFAEHHGLSEDQALRLLELAREVSILPHPDA